MKKLFVLFLTALLLLSLCACSGSKNNSVTAVCKDETGAPVAGAKIQLCSDSACFMSESDSKGNAVFDMAPGAYEIHVYKTPEGYLEPEQPLVNTTEQDTVVEFIFPKA